MYFNTPFMDIRPIVVGLGFLVLGFAVTFLVKLYKTRMVFVRLRRQGMPMPPHSFLFGHLGIINDILQSIPDDCHPHYYLDAIRQEYPDLSDPFYLDFWPFSSSMILVGTPDVASQFTQERSLPKLEDLRIYMEPLTGEKNLLTMEGKEWKTWRGIYNPGFAASHLMTLVPGIVEDVLDFSETLKKYANLAGMFKLEELTNRVTVDIIGRVVLDTKMNAQHSENDFLAGMRSQVKWLPIGNEINPLKKWNPIRPFVFRYNTRRMDRWLSSALDERFALRQGLGEAAMLKRSKPVIDLALDTYLLDQGLNEKCVRPMEDTFKAMSMNQIKLFLFAGHDTTSSTLCYMYYLLQKNPEIQKKLHAELDDVFGTDLTKTASLITENPHILNKLSYTVAVVKETLRLFAPASSVRVGEPDFFLNVNGVQYPTEGFGIWSVARASHHNPTLWPEAEAFIPERWLVPEGDPLYPVKGAFRPFEFGPRNCIGQEVVMLETRIIMALTVREFIVEPSYAEFDRRMGRVSKTFHGERAYQVLSGSAKAADGMPCRVRMR
ncbi:hypothetical protein MMC11_005919 [Xylographa trunciseda]|nr:hypothetical protein [Xylographa trunciseda]